MGGEINAGIGLELKEKLPDMRVWALGYSNLLRCYAAIKKSLRRLGLCKNNFSCHPERSEKSLPCHRVTKLKGGVSWTEVTRFAL